MRAAAGFIHPSAANKTRRLHTISVSSRGLQSGCGRQEAGPHVLKPEDVVSLWGSLSLPLTSLVRPQPWHGMGDVVIMGL